MKRDAAYYWRLIEDLDWAGLSKGAAFDYNAKQTYGFEKYGKMEMARIMSFAQQQVSNLYSAICEYRRKHGKDSIEIDSDDGMNDILWHIVGLGEHTFSRNLNDPSLLNERYAIRGYNESFAYVFHPPEPTIPKQKRLNKAQKIQILNVLIEDQANFRNALNNMIEKSLRIERRLTDLCADMMK